MSGWPETVGAGVDAEAGVGLQDCGAGYQGGGAGGYGNGGGQGGYAGGAGGGQQPTYNAPAGGAPDDPWATGGTTSFGDEPPF